VRKEMIQAQRRRHLNFIHFSLLAAFILMFGSWIFIFNKDKADLADLFSDKNIFYTTKFLKKMLGIGEENPAFTSRESWQNALRLTYETLQMSVMAIGFATLGMILTVIPAARTAADGTLTLTKKWYRWTLLGIIRFLYIFSRSVPELVWAMMIIFIFKPGILPGALALALHNFGILGKLCAEVVEDLDLRPIRNLATSGASSGQILFYGIIPTVMPKFITFILYRWEVILRTTIVVGFVGAGGLGYQFKLSMSWFNYSEITLLLLCYFLLAMIADLISEVARNLMD